MGAKRSEVDRQVVRTLRGAGANFACSVPCSLLAGILQMLSEEKRITLVPVTREEEGVGICAGAQLGGARPVLLMQNSGLGNSVNAILSLTKLYGLGLLLVLGFRGRRGEENIAAQIPMGDATPALLQVIGAKSVTIERPADLGLIREVAEFAFEGNVGAVLLTPRLWGEEHEEN